MKRALSAPVMKLLDILVPSAGLRKGKLSTIACPSPVKKNIMTNYMNVYLKENLNMEYNQ